MKRKITDYEFRVLRHLRKHQDRWFTTTQLSRRLRIEYFTVAQMLRRFRKQEKVIWNVHKRDFKGYPENIYKYQKDALDELIVDTPNTSKPPKTR